MFSVIKTGTCRRPSCTPIVNPTISGMIIDALAQVRITVLAPERCTCSTCFISLGCTYGPFFIDRDILASPRPTHNKFTRSFLLPAGLITQCWFTPRCLWSRHTNRGTPLASTVRVIHRVFCDTSHTRASPTVAGSPGFTQAFVLMVRIG